MSWSLGATGKKEDVLKTVRSQASGTSYKPGTPEGDDIVAATNRIEALAAPSTEIKVNAYGSHAVTTEGITSASFSVSVSVA